MTPMPETAHWSELLIVLTAVVSLPANLLGVLSALIDIRARELASINGEMQIVNTGRAIAEVLCLLGQIQFVAVGVMALFTAPPPPVLTWPQILSRLGAAVAILTFGALALSFRITRQKLYTYHREARR